MSSLKRRGRGSQQAEQQYCRHLLQQDNHASWQRLVNIKFWDVQPVLWRQTVESWIGPPPLGQELLNVLFGGALLVRQLPAERLPSKQTAQQQPLPNELSVQTSVQPSKHFNIDFKDSALMSLLPYADYEALVDEVCEQLYLKAIAKCAPVEEGTIVFEFSGKLQVETHVQLIVIKALSKYLEASSHANDLILTDSVKTNLRRNSSEVVNYIDTLSAESWKTILNLSWWNLQGRTDDALDTMRAVVELNVSKR